jgi:tetratricopeptide (TPR) repeat protein
VSPHLLQLQKRQTAAAASGDAQAAVCIEAEIAAYHARSGDIDAARAQLARLRARYGDGSHVRILAWICFAEGVLGQFDTLSGHCRERLQRARAFATAIRDQRLQALSAAWLGYDAFNHHDHAAMAGYLQEADRLNTDNDPTVAFRIQSVISAARVASRSLDLSAEDFRTNHAKVVSLGDRTGLAALILNRAAMMAAWLRVDNAITRHSVDVGLARFTELEIRTALYYKKLVGISSFVSFAHLWLAWTRMIQGDFEGAASLIEANLDESRARGLQRMYASVKSDLARCYLELGRLSEAQSVASTIVPDDEDEMDHDDRAVLHCNLSCVHLASGRPDEAASADKEARASYQKYMLECEDLLGTIDLISRGLINTYECHA